jgi:hypothetical protein
MILLGDVFSRFFLSNKIKIVFSTNNQTFKEGLVSKKQILAIILIALAIGFVIACGISIDQEWKNREQIILKIENTQSQVSIVKSFKVEGDSAKIILESQDAVRDMKVMFRGKEKGLLGENMSDSEIIDFTSNGPFRHYSQMKLSLRGIRNPIIVMDDRCDPPDTARPND